MKIIVSGSNGFIGNAFCDYIKDDYLRFDLPLFDILKINQYNIRNHDMLVHFAAIADLNDSIANQDRNFEVNIRGTYEVAKFCRDNGIMMVFISTCCVYHSNADIVDETDYPMTNEPYACSKMAGEYILKGMPDLNYTILRIGTVYGPGMRKELFNRLVFHKIMNQEIIKVNGNGEQERSYIYIDDLVDGIYRACLNFTAVKSKIINLCGIEKTSVNQTIQTASEITGIPYMADYNNFRYGDFDKENISVEKAARLLKWEPKVKYVDGMREVYNWLSHLQK